MQGCITKPVDPDQLFASLLEWIKPAERGITGEETPVVEEENVLTVQQILNVDRLNALKSVIGNKKVYLNVLEAFYSNNVTLVEDINQALNKGEKDKSLRLVHALKGVAGNIEANILCKTAVELENVIKTGNPLEIQDSLKIVKTELNIVLDSINHWRHSSAKEGTQPV